MDHFVELARLIWDVLWGVGTLCALAIAWWVKRWAAPKDELDTMTARLTRIEERVQHLPTNHDLTDVRDAVSKLGAQISKLAGEQSANARLLERINQYLMGRDR